MDDRVTMIMPMAGLGSRFTKSGEHYPKPLIELAGKPFFYWATIGVTRELVGVQLIYVVLLEHVERYAIDRKIKAYFPGASVVTVEHVTSGALETAMKALPLIHPDAALIINDCDHAFSYKKLADACEMLRGKGDGFLSHFNSKEAHFSYAEYSKDGNLLRTAEKEVISDLAIAGIYGFRNSSKLKALSEVYAKNCRYTELFISGVYNELVNIGGTVHGFPIDFHLSFGTPEQYALAQEHLEALKGLES